MNNDATIFASERYAPSVINDHSIISSQPTRPLPYNSYLLNSSSSSGSPVTKAPVFSSKTAKSTYNNHSTRFSEELDKTSFSHKTKPSRSSESPIVPKIINGASLHGSKSFNPQPDTKITRGPLYRSKSHKLSHLGKPATIPVGTTKSPSTDSKPLKRMSDSTSSNRPTLQTSYSSKLYKSSPSSRSLVAQNKPNRRSVSRSKSVKPSSVYRDDKSSLRSKDAKPTTEVSLVS